MHFVAMEHLWEISRYNDVLRGLSKLLHHCHYQLTLEVIMSNESTTTLAKIADVSPRKIGRGIKTLASKVPVRVVRTPNSES